LGRNAGWKSALQRGCPEGSIAEAPDDFFRDYQETLKARFEQVDIWISSREIQILQIDSLLATANHTQ
jgi:hypothetical protein